MALRARVSMIQKLASAIRTATRPGSASLPTRLASMPRLARATLTGQYRGMRTTTLLGWVVAFLYVVSPVDVMPEALLGVFGLVDDSLVLGWLAATMVTETEAFLEWEQQQGSAGSTQHASSPGPQTVPGSVVR